MKAKSDKEKERIKLEKQVEWHKLAIKLDRERTERMKRNQADWNDWSWLI